MKTIDADTFENLITDIYDNAENEKFMFSDKYGNVIIKIDNQGIHSKNFLTPDKNLSKAFFHPLMGKKVWYFGDSHTTGSWMFDRVQELTECDIDQTKNRIINGQSKDPSSALYQRLEYATDNLQKSLIALKELVDNDDEIVDAIFLEQTHYVFDDNVDAEPFVGTQLLEYNSVSNPFASKEAMMGALDTDIKTYLSEVTSSNRKSCSVLKVFYSTTNDTIAFASTNSTLNAGTFKLVINGNEFSVNVTQGMTIPQALTALNQWQFGDVPECEWVNTNHHTTITGNSMVLTYRGDGTPSTTDITLIDSGTGISISSQTLDGNSTYNYFLFMCHAPSQWLNMDNWKYYDRNEYKYGYAILKGTFELAQSLFPTAKIYTWYPVSLDISSINPPRYFEDGTFDVISFENNSYHWKECVAGVKAWRAASEVYNIPFVDVKDDCGMSPINYESWYNSGIHPTNDGYKRWGEVLVSKL